MSIWELPSEVCWVSHPFNPTYGVMVFAFDVGRSMFEVGCSSFNTVCWVSHPFNPTYGVMVFAFDVGRSMFEVGCSSFNTVQCSLLSASRRIAINILMARVTTPLCSVTTSMAASDTPAFRASSTLSVCRQELQISDRVVVRTI